MQREGHIGVALAAYAPVAFVTTALGFDDLAFLGALATVGLAMIPDVDLRLPFVPHRGLTHTVWFALLSAVAGGLFGWSVGAARGLLSGIGLALLGAVVTGSAVGSHLAADALTPMGIRPFAPLWDREFTYALTRATNPIANVLLLSLGTGVAICAFVLGSWVAGL